MDGDADVAAAASLLADPTRAAILMELADGRALPPSELAAVAGVSRSTVSEHLARLQRAGVVAVERGGRNRYYRVANQDVAGAIEALAVIAPRHQVRSLRQSSRSAALAAARTCYGHLAGRLGVDLAEAMLARGALERVDGHFALTDAGARELREVGIARPPRTGKACNDWSERRPHLGGPLGVALAKRLFELGWIERGATPRTVRLTDVGHTGLRQRFGIAVRPEG